MRVRSVYAAYLLPAMVCLGTATVCGEEVEIVPRLRVGDEFSLRVIHTREDSSRPQHNTRVATTIAVRVLTATPEGLTLAWTPGEASVDDARAARDPAATAPSQALRGITLHVKLGTDGEFAGLANQDELVLPLQARADGLLRELTNNVPEEQREKFQSTMAAVLSPPTLIASATHTCRLISA
jgi:hypothetical protein